MGFVARWPNRTDHVNKPFQAARTRRQEPGGNFWSTSIQLSDRELSDVKVGTFDAEAGKVALILVQRSFSDSAQALPGEVLVDDGAKPSGFVRLVEHRRPDHPRGLRENQTRLIAGRSRSSRDSGGGQGGGASSLAARASIERDVRQLRQAQGA
jgi:hypothetical protein